MTNDVLLYRLGQLAKEYYDLYNNSGLCGMDCLYSIPEVLLDDKEFNNLFHSNMGVELKHRDDSEYSWERSVIVDGVRFFNISDKGIGGMANGTV